MKGILWAVVIDPLTVERLYECGQPHHCTLQFGVEKADWEYLIGYEFTAYCHEVCNDADIQAMRVLLPNEVACKSLPHITVSYREGIAPMVSNAMLAGEHTAKELTLAIKLRVEFLEWTS